MAYVKQHLRTSRKGKTSEVRAHNRRIVSRLQTFALSKFKTRGTDIRDNFLRRKIIALKRCTTKEDLARVISRIYDDGFFDGLREGIQPSVGRKKKDIISEKPTLSNKYKNEMIRNLKHSVDDDDLTATIDSIYFDGFNKAEELSQKD